MKTIIINGSPHKDGRMMALLSGLPYPIVHLSDGIAPALDMIKKAETIVFASPVRWFNVSALMKELIDEMPESPDFPLYGKEAFFLVGFEEDGGQQAINQMFAPLNHMGFKIPPHACFFYNYNMAEKSEDKWQLTAIEDLKKRLEGIEPVYS